jgi:MFS family permease
VFAGSSLASLVAYAMLVWLPPFLIRSHGLSTAQVGTALALIIGVVGGLGTWLGGQLAARWSDRNGRWRVWVVALALVVLTPSSIAVYLAQNAAAALALFLVPAMLLGVYVGPTFALVQGLVRPGMRAFAAAWLLFAGNLVGLGLGPQLVGVLSDLLSSRYGVESLRYALVLVTPISLWAAYHYWRAARSLAMDLERATMPARITGHV